MSKEEEDEPSQGLRIDIVAEEGDRWILFKWAKTPAVVHSFVRKLEKSVSFLASEKKRVPRQIVIFLHNASIIEELKTPIQVNFKASKETVLWLVKENDPYPSMPMNSKRPTNDTILKDFEMVSSVHQEIPFQIVNLDVAVALQLVQSENQQLLPARRSLLQILQGEEKNKRPKIVMTRTAFQLFVSIVNKFGSAEDKKQQQIWSETIEICEDVPITPLLGIEPSRRTNQASLLVATLALDLSAKGFRVLTVTGNRFLIFSLYRQHHLSSSYFFLWLLTVSFVSKQS
jgi:hypothetical protein